MLDKYTDDENIPVEQVQLIDEDISIKLSQLIDDLESYGKKDTYEYYFITSLYYIYNPNFYEFNRVFYNFEKFNKKANSITVKESEKITLNGDLILSMDALEFQMLCTLASNAFNENIDIRNKFDIDLPKRLKELTDNSVDHLDITKAHYFTKDVSIASTNYYYLMCVHILNLCGFDFA